MLFSQNSEKIPCYVKKDNSSKNDFPEKILCQNMHLGVMKDLTQGFSVKIIFWRVVFFFDIKFSVKTGREGQNMEIFLA